MDASYGSAAGAEEARVADQGSEAAKEGKRGGKADRPRPAAKAKAEGEVFEECGDHAGARERGPGGGKGGKGGRDRKENWKERGGGSRDTQQNAAAASGGKDGWKDRRRRDGGGRPPMESEVVANNENFGPANSQALRGSGATLLNLLKANPPGATRYTQEQLLSIGQLPASKVKPPSLNEIINKQNGESPLLFKAKNERDNEHGEAKEDGDSRRERREHRSGGAAAGLPAGRANRGTLEEEEEEENPDRRWHGRKSGGNEERRPPVREANDPDSQWDMPDAGSNAGMFGGDLSDLANFTLGDIRKAEKSMSSGMSFKDYKASLRAEEVGTGALQGTGAVSSSTAAAAVAATAGDSPFDEEAPGGDADDSFFAEEEGGDVCGASRGFGKWFGGRAEGAPATPATASAAPRAAAIGARAATATPPLAAAPRSPPAASSLASPPPAAAAGSTASAGAAAQRSPPGGRPQPQPPESPAAPLGLNSSIEALLAEEPVLPSRKQEPTIAADVPAVPPALSSPAGAGSNLAGRSILSMLGRTSAPTAASTSTPVSAEEGKQQGKLSVAELFHLAQGKDLPPIPDSSSGAAAADAETERRAQWEALRAAQFMWAAAKAQQPSMPSAGRFPYPAGPCGAMPPGDHPFHEAYAQAMMGMGAAAWSGAGKGAAPHTAWPPPPMAQGCPPYPGAAAAWGYSAPHPYGPCYPGFDPSGAAAVQGCYPNMPSMGGAAAAAMARGAAEGHQQAAAQRLNKAPAAASVAAGAVPGPAVGLNGLLTGTIPAQPGQGEDDAGCSQS